MLKRLFLLLCAMCMLLQADPEKITTCITGLTSTEEIIAGAVADLYRAALCHDEATVSEVLLSLKEINRPVDMSDVIIAACQSIKKEVLYRNIGYMTSGVFAVGSFAPWLLKLCPSGFGLTTNNCLGLSLVFMCAATIGHWHTWTHFHNNVEKSSNILKRLLMSQICIIADSKKVKREVLRICAVNELK